MLFLREAHQVLVVHFRLSLLSGPVKRKKNNAQVYMTSYSSLILIGYELALRRFLACLRDPLVQVSQGFLLVQMGRLHLFLLAGQSLHDCQDHPATLVGQLRRDCQEVQLVLLNQYCLVRLVFRLLRLDQSIPLGPFE